MSHDWLPRKRDEQIALAKKWVAELPNHYGRWKVTEAEVDELKEFIDDVEASQEKIAEGATAFLTARLREEFAALVKYMRWIHRTKLFSPPMDESDWIRLGLKPPDNIRTPQPVPTSVPEIEAITSVIRQLSLRIRDFGSKSWGKPDHVHAIELAWEIRDDRPALVEDMPNLEVETRSPIVLAFEDDQRGSRVYFAARWINNTAKGGPWSDIESAFVP
jgi:hypothetical protein